MLASGVSLPGMRRSRTAYSTWTPQKPTLFDGHYLCNRSTLDIGVLGYIGIVQHKEHFPEVLSIPPGTPCIYIYIYIYIYISLHTLLTQSVTEMSDRNISWEQRWQVPRVDNLSSSMCRLSWNQGAWTSWNPLGLSRSVMGLFYIITHTLQDMAIWKDSMPLQLKSLTFTIP